MDEALASSQSAAQTSHLWSSDGVLGNVQMHKVWKLWQDFRQPTRVGVVDPGVADVQVLQTGAMLQRLSKHGYFRDL
eukprot:3100361-Rhodomonas_salina.1